MNNIDPRMTLPSFKYPVGSKVWIACYQSVPSRCSKCDAAIPDATKDQVEYFVHQATITEIEIRQKLTCSQENNNIENTVLYVTSHSRWLFNEEKDFYDTEEEAFEALKVMEREDNEL